MPLVSRVPLLIVGASILVIGVAGCGDDDDGGDGSAGSGTSGAVGTSEVEAVVTTVEDVVSSTTEGVEVTVEVTSTSAGDQRDGGVVPEGFEAVVIMVTAADGSSEEYCVWLAESSRQHQRGLMEVTDLDAAVGMLFAYGSEVESNFWMANTPMPLSIAFFDAGGAFISSTDMEPCLDADTSGCERYSAAAAYQYALEVPRGDLDALGIGDGASVALDRSTATDSCPPV